MTTPGRVQSVAEQMIRDAYEAGSYAASCDEGYYLAKNPDGSFVQPETADEVVARLLATGMGGMDA